MSASPVSWLRERFGIVRLRQIADQFRHRLSFIPGVYVVVSIIFAQATLLFDRTLSNEDMPALLSTTVDSARSVFTAIAGGLITSITLLLSMMLITVQLASSQFSPRTLRDWLGDSYLKHTIGVTLGTTVFCLLALRSTRSFDEQGSETIPHSSVIIAVVLGVVSLFAVVRSVDHITQSLRIGSVARRIANETIAVVEHGDDLGAGERPEVTPAVALDADQDDDHAPPISSEAFAVEAPTSGWIQQIRMASVVERLPEGSTAHVVVPLGAFVPRDTPLIWVDPPPDDPDDFTSTVLEAFAMGDTRTMQRDVGFGVVQLTDIAVRALSPGINDPTTANDIIVHLGDVLLSIWAQPLAESRIERDGRTVYRRRPRHEDHLHEAIDPIRRHGVADPTVLTTLIRTLEMIRSEVERRNLPGPIAPLDEAIVDTRRTADRATWTNAERTALDELPTTS